MTAAAPALDALRLDRFLVAARFCRTRSLAASLVEHGRVRINGQRAQKPARSVRPGDVLTLSLARGVRVIRVAQLTERRGPAAEAALLYEVIEPDSGETHPC